MKKIIVFFCLLFTAGLLLAGCGQQINVNVNSAPTSTEQNNEAVSSTPEQTGQPLYYVSKNLDIKFQYGYGFSDKAYEQGDKIMYPGYGTPEHPEYIEVFTKDGNQSIEAAILDVIKKQGKNPKDCQVVTRGAEDNGDLEYTVDLVNPNIIYTPQEKQEIKQADADAKADGGPFNGDWKKQEIYNQRLVGKCSAYAEPLGLGTSKTGPATFLYNATATKTKFVFLTPAMDAQFYEYGTIEFLCGGVSCPVASSAPASTTADWKTFTDAKQEIAFRYPDTLPTTYIRGAEWPPKITIAAGNLKCSTTSPASSSPSFEQIVSKQINGRTYCVQSLAEGAAGSIYTTYDYSAAVNNKLITAAFTIQEPQCANYDDPQQSACFSEEQTYDLDGLVEQIVSGIQFK